MLAVPTATAVTKPVLAFTVATNILSLLHTPPGVPLLEYAAVAPIQSGVVPDIVPGIGQTPPPPPPPGPGSTTTSTTTFGIICFSTTESRWLPLAVRIVAPANWAFAELNCELTTVK